MKKSILILGLTALFFSACDKIDAPFIPGTPTELDQSLYPGTWSSYPWPVFTANTNTNRNILLEDYTGHQCIYCPAAATIAAQIEEDNPTRVFVASIHISPNGIGPFQATNADYPYDFTNPQGIEYGATFGNGFGFDANPKGTVARKVFNGTLFQGANNWTSVVSQTLAENNLKTNLQAVANYYPSTRGLFLHTEIDTMSQPASELSIVVYLIENSFISKQKLPGGEFDANYKHHNVHRGSIDGKAFGRILKPEDRNTNGKFYQNYSYKLPAQYDPANCHLLVYAMNKNTYEVYQVVKVDIP